MFLPPSHNTLVGIISQPNVHTHASSFPTPPNPKCLYFYFSCKMVYYAISCFCVMESAPKTGAYPFQITPAHQAVLQITATNSGTSTNLKTVVEPTQMKASAPTGLESVQATSTSLVFSAMSAHGAATGHLLSTMLPSPAS